VRDLRAQYGQYALVTGASAGIGEQFAVQLAEAGFDLVLVARRKEKLDALAVDLRSQFGVAVEVVELDLDTENASAALLTRTQHLDIGIAVLSAGIFTSGPFVGNTLADETRVLTLNVLVPMQLAHHYGRDMATRNRGAIILVASTVGHQAAPYVANYAATKAYIATLGQSLNYELKKSGVDVLVLSPGPTKTEGVESAVGIDFTNLPVPMMEPKRVVRKALNGLGHRSLAIPGGINKFMDLAGKYLIPRPVLTKMYGLLLRRTLKTAI
jgi:uncharacterized protein